GSPAPAEIIHVIAHSPAMQSGVRPHDLIISIDEVLTSTLSRDEIMFLVRGQPGTSVRLRIRRGRRQFNLDIRRQALALRSVRASVQAFGGKTIGYLVLEQFTSKTSQETQDAITQLNAQHVD